LRSDFADLIDAALDGRLDRAEAEWDPRPSRGVVIAAQGYPGKPKTGDAISGLDADFGTDVKVFHAGTKLDGDGRALTAGGRVLCVCALGNDLSQARDRAYGAARHIDFDGAFHRRDIGHRALAQKA
ncbi:MAG TPA: phosphoribosylglycinamide synthetase C domain-containing protein, partial [Rhodanobacteraceae bacterium]|nr:phosphoribosylglycinamide synthetase C domain-containing protein [Rhodanobacteraceae bacterium]